VLESSQQPAWILEDGGVDDGFREHGCGGCRRSGV
jgi:hypothetical protein